MNNIGNTEITQAPTNTPHEDSEPSLQDEVVLRSVSDKQVPVPRLKVTVCTKSTSLSSNANSTTTGVRRVHCR